MAREQSRERQPDHSSVEAPHEIPATQPSHDTSFVTQGTIPPVETGAAPPQTATASERAYGQGPGIQATEKLLAGGGAKADKVAEVIDAHRDEHDAILSLVRDKLGASFAETVRAELGHVRASISRKELAVGDPGDPESGYVVVSQKEGGAKWRTGDGNFTGTANKDGLDSKYKLDAHDSLHAHVGKDKSGSLAWERDGKNEGELYGHVGGGKDYELGLRRDFDVDGGKLTAGAQHKVDGRGTTDGVFGNYKRGETSAETSLGMRDGSLAASGSIATHRGHDQFSASVDHDGKGTSLDARDTHDFGGGYTGTAHLHHGPEGTTGELAGSYKDSRTSVDANIARGLDQTSLHLGAEHKPTPQLTLSGAMDHVMPDKGPSQSSLQLGEHYRSGDVIQGLDLSLGHGARDYVKSTGSVDAKLAPHTYGGLWASTETEAGHETSAQIGGSLTFTTNEKTALTLAGVVDQHGRLETRLQFDVFKSKIESISDLDHEKKNAMLSLFLSYSQGGNNHMLDDRLGSPSIDTNVGSQVTAGIKIRF